MQELKEIRKIHESMKSLKQWLQRNLYDIDWVLKLRPDIGHYFHKTARLEMRLKRVERELGIKEEIE